MWNKASIASALCVAIIGLALPSAANAATGRTWVSTAGVDSGTCSRTAPCATFQFAYNNTTAGGEIIALDTTGYGPLNITHAITVTGLEPAFIAVQSSTTGITINAATTDVITLRNIQIIGAPSNTNTTGILLSAGRLIFEKSTLRNLSKGLILSNAANTSITRAIVVDSDIIGNGLGIEASGLGVDTGTSPNTGITWALLIRGNVMYNAQAFLVHAPGANSASILAAPASQSNSMFHAGNPILITGDGAGCPCTNYGTYSQQLGQTFN